MSDKIQAFMKKLDASPSNRFHRYNLAQAYYEQGDYENARIQFTDCLTIANDWMMASLGLGKCYLALEDFERAKRNLSLTIDLAEKQGHDDPLEEAKSLLKQCSSSC